jgi:hypothetical protein
MPMDSILMCPNTLYMSNMDAGKQFEVAVSLNHDIITSFLTPQVTQNPKI